MDYFYRMIASTTTAQIGNLFISILQIAEGNNYKSEKVNIQACTEANARMSKLQQKQRKLSQNTLKITIIWTMPLIPL